MQLFEFLDGKSVIWFEILDDKCVIHIAHCKKIYLQNL